MFAFQYPAWLVLVCIAAGLGYAWLLYRHDTVYEQTVPVFKKMKWVLFTFRALAVAIIATLLLSPLIKTLFSETEKPIIIIAQDNSASIKLKMKGADSAKIFQSFEKLKKELGDDYDVKNYSFGTDLKENNSINFSEKATNISDALVGLSNLYGNQNVGAVILSSDGIYNQGSNPIYTHGDWQVPFYTVALGDTTVQKDAFINKIYYNKTCYLHDQLSVKVELGANYLSGQQASVVVSKVEAAANQSVFNKTVSYTNNAFSTSFDFLIDAKATGIHHYKINLATVTGEATAINNVQDIYIEVLDARQKILLLASSPHPDLAAIKTLIETNNNYDCAIQFADAFNPKTLGDYNLVILHQLPAATNNPVAILKAIADQKIPTLYILGSTSALYTFNQQQQLLQVNGNAQNTNEVLANVNKDFNSFIVDDAQAQALQSFPPLIAPFADYKISPTASVLAFQKIGSANTKFPLICFGEINGNKLGVICGEGFWRWKLADYQQHQNFDVVKELMNKIVQLLIVKNDKRRFKANPLKNLFYENENIEWEAILYNDNYEFINTPDVALMITDEAGKNFTYTFNKTERAYNLNAGFLPVGKYAYTAKTNYNNTALASAGNFSVSPLQLEGLQTTANHQLLYSLSQKTNGKMVYPDSISSIANYIKKSELIKPVIYTTHKTTSALNLKWIFFLLLILISCEWFIRKYLGGY